MYERERTRFIMCRDMGEERLVCPKPRRAVVGICSAAVDTLKPVRRLRSHLPLAAEGEAGHEILDILFSKVSLGDAGSIDPSFGGSPPSRAGNPLIHDVQFTTKRATPVLPHKFTCNSGSNASVKSACGASYGSKPFVRIVGFAAASTGPHQGVPTFA